MRLWAIATILLVSQAAGASSRFEVIGLSKTHLALRELYSRSECCGADPVVDCHYEGVTQLEKRLEAVKSGLPRVVVPQRFGAVRLHVLPWKAGALVGPAEKTVEALRTFEVYESVTKKEACTPKATSTARLAEAHAYAKSVGIDLKAPLEAATLEGDPTLSAERCTAEKYDPTCRPAELAPPAYFVFGEVPDTRILHLFVEVAPGRWRQATVANNGGAWLSPRREASNEVGRVVHFRRFTHFMSDVNEVPLFLVEPRSSSDSVE